MFTLLYHQNPAVARILIHSVIWLTSLNRTWK